MVYKSLENHLCYGLDGRTSGGVTAAVNVFASDGVLCAANSSIDFAGVEQTSSLRKGFADLARGVLAAVELSSIGPNNWLRSSKRIFRLYRSRPPLPPM